MAVIDLEDKNENLEIKTKESNCGMILIAGLPLNEPIV